MHLICRQKMKEGKLTNSGWQRSFFFFSSTQPAPPARLCSVALTFNWHGPVRLEERTAGQVKVSTIEHSILFFSKFFFPSSIYLLWHFVSIPPVAHSIDRIADGRERDTTGTRLSPSFSTFWQKWQSDPHRQDTRPDGNQVNEKSM